MQLCRQSACFFTTETYDLVEVKEQIDVLKQILQLLKLVLYILLNEVLSLKQKVNAFVFFGFLSFAFLPSVPILL